MIVIDPKGLQEGERLAACSDLAQLHWPRLFLASNGYGRLELSYSGLLATVYRSFKRPPSETALWGFFEEYAKNFLVILYAVDGAWWAQFVTSEKYLPRYKTARDERSPAPPQELRERHHKGYVEWKASKSLANQRFQKFSETFPKVSEISAAVAVSVADAEKPTPKASPSSFVRPDWVPEIQWDGWLDLRKKKGVKNTDCVLGLAVKKLDKLRAEGEDPAEVLEEATLRGWTGLFPVKFKTYNGNGSPFGKPEQRKPRILPRPAAGGAA